MTSYQLSSPREALQHVARVLQRDQSCSLCVREGKAFGDRGWLNLGEIAIDPNLLEVDQIVTGIQRGAYEWRLPSLGSVPHQSIE